MKKQKPKAKPARKPSRAAKQRNVGETVSDSTSAVVHGSASPAWPKKPI